MYYHILLPSDINQKHQQMQEHIAHQHKRVVKIDTAIQKQEKRLNKEEKLLDKAEQKLIASQTKLIQQINGTESSKRNLRKSGRKPTKVLRETVE